MNTKALLQAQVDSPTIGNPHGRPSWRITGKGELLAVEGRYNKDEQSWFQPVAPRYKPQTWDQLIKAFQKRTGAHWESPVRNGESKCA